MSRNKSIVLSMGLGLLAFAFFQLKAANFKRALLAEYGSATSVVVAKRDILPGMPMEKDDIAVAQIPSAFAQPGGITAIDEVLGQFTRIPILKGEQVLRTKLALEEGGYLSLRIGDDPEMRAITLKFDGEGGMAGLLHPGDTVDVMGVFESASSGDAGTRNHAMVLAQSVTILAVDQRMSEVVMPPSPGEGGFGLASGTPSQSKSAWSITLKVKAGEAWKLSLAAQVGHLRCVLRQRTNQKLHDYAPVTEASTALQSAEVFGAGGKTIYPSGQPKPAFTE